MIKKLIIITAAGLVSFAGAFVFAWLTHSPPAKSTDPSEKSVLTDNRVGQESAKSETDMMGAFTSTSSPTKKSMTEQQLRELILNVREKMREYEEKVKGLSVQEKRLQVAQQVLREDIDNLNNLRIELVSTVAQLRNEQDRLLKSRLEIDKLEKANLVSIAATYDKMDSSSASKILMNMCKTDQMQNIKAGEADYNLDDAVKILHYMTERTKAKLLAELVTSEPSLAASLCNRLKQIVERE